MTIAQIIRNLFATAGSEEGQIIAEYGLILALVMVACVGGLTLLAASIPLPFETFVDAATGGGS
jgi:Flp pilus assembly pilin Flp